MSLAPHGRVATPFLPAYITTGQADLDLDLDNNCQSPDGYFGNAGPTR